LREERFKADQQPFVEEDKRIALQPARLTGKTLHFVCAILWPQPKSLWNWGLRPSSDSASTIRGSADVDAGLNLEARELFALVPAANAFPISMIDMFREMNGKCDLEMGSEYIK
jgi:hypothetical protein